MRAYEELRRDTLALFQRTADICTNRGYRAPRAAAAAQEARKRLEDGLLTVVTCGEYKRGKSMLLDALLDDPGLFPSSSMPATNAVTLARWAATESITVTLAPDVPDGPARTVHITRDELPDYVTEAGNPGNRLGVLEVAIDTPNPKLRPGLVFVDTPGIGGVVQAHSAATFTYVPQADALLFITDVEQPMLDGEMAFLRAALAAAKLTDREDVLVTALTKIDQEPDYTAILADTRTKLAALTGKPEADPIVVPVSAWSKLAHLASPDPAVLAASNVPELESVLWTTLQRRRVPALIGDGVQSVLAWNRALLAPIETAERAAADATGRKLDDLRDEYQRRSDAARRLETDSKDWPATLRRRLRRAQDLAKGEAQAALDRNWQRFSVQYLYDDALVVDVERLCGRLTTDLSMLVGGLRDLVVAKATEAVTAVSTELGIALTAPGAPNKPDVPPPTIPDLDSLNGASKHGNGIVTRNTAAAASLGGLAGGAVALGIAVLAGPAAILLIAASPTIFAGVAGWLGFRDAKAQVAAQQLETHRNNVSRALAPTRPTQERYVHGVITMMFQDLDVEMEGLLRNLITREKETADNVLQRLDDEQKAQRDGRATGAAAYAQERAPLDAVIADALALEAEVSSAAPAPTGAGTRTAAG